MGQVHHGSGGGTTVPKATTVPSPGPGLSAVQASTPLRVKDSIDCLPSLHPCFGSSCGNGADCRVFRANTLHSESVSPRQRQNPRTSATAAAVCIPPTTCHPSPSRRSTTHRTTTCVSDEREDQPPRAPFDEQTTAVGFARHGSSCLPRYPVAPPFSCCLAMQWHRITTACTGSNVTVGGVVCVATPARETVAT